MALTATHVKTYAHGVRTETILGPVEIGYVVWKGDRPIFVAAIPLTASARRQAECAHRQESAARAAELTA